MGTQQQRLDEQNAAFWDELCGTNLAKMLGISDASTASLAKFDRWYFGFYPYLAQHIPFGRVRGRHVLEVGLGFGSVAQLLGESGAHYTGLDVAAGPVAMVEHRFVSAGLECRAVQGNILDAPFDNNQFDYVVAIGCYHHTGNLQGAFDETHRVLKPGGQAIIMLYNATSYRRWLNQPQRTAKHIARQLIGLTDIVGGDEKERAAYDFDSSGVVAPETVFVSRRTLAHMTGAFAEFDATVENIGTEHILGRLGRARSLSWLRPFIRIAGVDIYVTLRK